MSFITSGNELSLSKFNRAFLTLKINNVLLAHINQNNQPKVFIKHEKTQTSISVITCTATA